MSEQPEKDELELLREFRDRLYPFDREAQYRILDYLNKYFHLGTGEERTGLAEMAPRSVHTHTNDRRLSFSDRETLSAKDFLHDKQPRTDIERVACLAYYLAHYRDTPHFKAIDVSKLNTEAAQLKFSNPAYTVVNATNSGLLTPAGKGAKQISAIGERFVDALPNRDDAKAVLGTMRPRRRRKKSAHTKEARKATK